MIEILGFSKIEYLITFQSIIIGFVASMYLDGWGQILRMRKRIRPDLVFGLFTVVLFAVMLIHWWNLYGRALKVTRNILEFLSIIPYTAVFYFLAVVLFGQIKKRTQTGERLDLYVLFQEQRVKLYGLLLFFFCYDLPLTIHQESLVFRVGGIAICLAGLFVKHRNLHLFLMGLSVCFIGIYTFHDYRGWIPERPIGNTYSKAEHLTIFISVIYGYIIAVFLRGWAGLFQIKSHAFSATQFLWSLFSFVFLIVIWWDSWERTGYITTSLLHFVVLLIVPFVIYLICVLLFPNEDTESYSNHFFENKGLIFAFFASLLLLQIGLSFLFEEPAGNKNYIRLGGAVLALVSIKVNNLRYHKIIIAAAFALLILNMLRV